MVKLLYQHEFGPGHMISDEAGSLQRLTAEWESLSHSPSAPFMEAIGNGLVRVHLAALDKTELPALNSMFCLTAGHIDGSKEKFLQYLDCLPSFFPDAGSFLTDYKKRGCPPLSHSNTYRRAYHPAYRVITEGYARFLQLIRSLSFLFHEKGRLIVAIDGNCASGKTTLGHFLSLSFDCNVIPMDDFFLPPGLRTASRLAEPGGNIHYERFGTDVKEALQAGRTISYLPFSCSTMDYGKRIILPPKPFTVIEGSYCMRPEFCSLYDYSVFLSCPYDQQIKRIRIRNGEEMLQNFITKWIPMENAYFDAFHVRENCSVVIEQKSVR